MIRFTTENGEVVVVAETEGYGIYLDNDSLMDLAKGNATRQKRFVTALQAKATLLFSLANVIEVAGPTYSARTVRDFLNSIGPHWVPLELNPWKVAKREAAGLGNQAVVSPSFMQWYHERRADDLSQGNRVLDLSHETFFRLGTVVNWMQECRDEILADATQIDDEVRRTITTFRSQYEKDAIWLDQILPPRQFDERAPATFVLVHLQRLLIKEAKAYQFKKGDGLDLCHAVVAAAYGSLITLDKQWRRRVQALPEAEKLARTYYRPEIDKLIATMESLDEVKHATNGARRQRVQAQAGSDVTGRKRGFQE